MPNIPNHVSQHSTSPSLQTCIQQHLKVSSSPHVEGKPTADAQLLPQEMSPVHVFNGGSHGSLEQFHSEASQCLNKRPKHCKIRRCIHSGK